MSTIERLRASSPNAGIFAVAMAADPDLILQSMRAGANEFFTWPLADEPLHSAVRRTAARRESAQGAKPPATTLVFFGAKGGAGTTTLAVNCAVELARLSKRATVIRRSETGAGRGRTVPRRPAPFQRDRRHRQPASAGSRVPARTGGEAQVGAGDPGWIGSVRSSRRRRRRRHRGTAPAADAAVRLHRRGRRQPGEFVHRVGALHGGSAVPRREPGCAVGPQRAAAAGSRASARRVRRARPPAAQSRRRAVPDSAQADRRRARASDSPHVPERLQDRVERAELRRAAGAERRQHRSGAGSSTASRGRFWGRAPTCPRPRATGRACSISSASRRSGKHS